jgi:hypothetical protein
MNEVEVISEEEIQEKFKQAMADPAIKRPGWFHVGDFIQINGRIFRVKGVKPTEIRLKLVREPPK